MVNRAFALYAIKNHSTYHEANSVIKFSTVDLEVFCSFKMMHGMSTTIIGLQAILAGEAAAMKASLADEAVTDMIYTACVIF